MRDKLVITTDDIYEYELEERSSYEYFARFVDSERRIVGRQIHAENFKQAYYEAEHILKSNKFVRIISIEEVSDEISR